MRAFIVLVSLMALGLGFAGTALGVRPRPVAAGSSEDDRRIASLERQVEVLTTALADLEQRFDDHRARTPATLDEVDEPAPTPDAEPTPIVVEAAEAHPVPAEAEAEAEPEPEVVEPARDAPTAEEAPAPDPEARPAVEIPSDLPRDIVAALSRAAERLEAGDAPGARSLYEAIRDRSDLSPETRLHVRLALAGAYESEDDWISARSILEAIESDLGDATPDDVRRRADHARSNVCK